MGSSLDNKLVSEVGWCSVFSSQLLSLNNPSFADFQMDGLVFMKLSLDGC